jgi:redox-sensitive bicupin YhaK (pirin superfamily)
MMDPRYRDVKRTDIPEVSLPGGVAVRVICGTVGKTRGPVRDIVIDPEYLDVAMPPGAEFVHQTKPGHTVLAYVFEGQGCFSDEPGLSSYDVEPASYFDLERKPFLGDHSVILFDDGGRIKVATTDSSVRFLLIAGRPLGVVNLPRNRENRCPKSVSRRETPPHRLKDDRLPLLVITNNQKYSPLSSAA